MKRYAGTLTQDCTVTLSLNDNEDVQLLLSQDSVTGGRHVTWVGIGTWLTPTGSPPTLHSAAGASDFFEFSKVNGTVIGIHRGETGPAGAAGPIGPAGITWQGSWSGSKSGGYVPRDAVYYGGSSYIATAASSNVTPVAGLGTSWDLLALAGQAGQASDTEDNFHRATEPSGTGATGISVGAPSSITYGFVGDSGGDPRTSIVSHQLTCTWAGSGGPDSAYASTVALTGDDHHSQITVGNGSVFNANDSVIGVLARLTNASSAGSAKTGYSAFFLNFGTAAVWWIKLLRWSGSGAATIGTPVQMPAGPQVNDIFKISVSGATISAFLNGALVTSVVDPSPITTGKYCGFMASLGSAGETARFSDFRYGLG